MDYLFQPVAAYFLYHLFIEDTTSVVSWMSQVIQAVPDEVLVIMAGLL